MLPSGARERAPHPLAIGEAALRLLADAKYPLLLDAEKRQRGSPGLYPAEDGAAAPLEDARAARGACRGPAISAGRQIPPCLVSFPGKSRRGRSRGLY
jgi:hypothetical protein